MRDEVSIRLLLTSSFIFFQKKLMAWHEIMPQLTDTPINVTIIVVSHSYAGTMFTLCLCIFSILTLFIPSNFRGINLSGLSNFQCWVLPQNKLEKKNPVVSITFKFCVNVAKCLFLMF